MYETPAGYVHVDPATDADMPGLIALVANRFPDLSIDNELIIAVHRHSRSILAVKYHGELIGCWAGLFLNPAGLENLLDGTLSATMPPLSCLAGAGESASAIYSWMLLAPKHGANALGGVLLWLRSNGYSTVDIYGTPINDNVKAFFSFHGASQLSETSPLWVLRGARA